MYISVKKHILSNSILMVAVIKIIAAIFEGSIRFFMNRSSLSPDMLNTSLWLAQAVSSLLQIAAVIVIFYTAWRRLDHYMNIVPQEDRREMGRLQEEIFGKNVASLSATSVSRLLQLWAVIFIGAELIYCFTSLLYRRFIEILMGALYLGSGFTDGYFVLLYNMTHGFKYIEILTAILLGVVMTGIFLNDRYLKIAALTVAVFFMLAFGVFQMQNISFMGREVGVVWTSLIYHATETLGLIVLSRYLARKYRGL